MAKFLLEICFKKNAGLQESTLSGNLHDHRFQF